MTGFDKAGYAIISVFLVQAIFATYYHPTFVIQWSSLFFIAILTQL